MPTGPFLRRGRTLADDAEEDPTAGLDADLEAVAQEEGPTGKKFGTFGGVFTPTILTVLGVIMYLRLGWVVGNAGLLGALAIILLAFGITIATGLSLSSITTNIRIGGGGAYSVISQSLGIEIGGSIGIPLYISQGLAVSMYVFGFREGWQYVFPTHSSLLVDLSVFGILFALAFVSSGLAFRVQYVIMAVIAASLVAVVGAAATGSMVYTPELIGDFPGAPEDGFRGTSFWVVFAVFFPAATGIMAGANMSGDLEEPRRSIPLGTMSAILLSLAIYLGVAYWLATSATPTELVTDYTIMIDRAMWGPAVIAGLLGATFSSALASLVGAPRILEALGTHQLLPAGDWLAERSATGEPHRALLVTGVIVLAALMLRSLNAVAPLITMFFLITYAMVNVVVLVEQSLGLVSFRPLLRIPTVVPLLGAVGCVVTMFIINATFGLVSVVLVVGLYAYLVRRSLDAPYGDVRSGLFFALTEWGAKKVGALAGTGERAWRPNLLVPVQDPDRIRRNFHFVRNLTYPHGLVKLLGVTDPREAGSIEPQLEDLRSAFSDEGLFVTSTGLGSSSFDDGVVDAMQTLRGSFFRPNIVFLPSPRDDEEAGRAQRIVDRAPENGLGAILFHEHPRAGLGRRRRVNLWIPSQGPRWSVGMDLGNLDLAILTAYTLSQNWDATLRVLTHVEDPDEREEAERYLENLMSLARLPADTEPVVIEGSLEGAIPQSPEADLCVMPLVDAIDHEHLARTVEDAGASCVWTLDSDDENALA